MKKYILLILTVICTFSFILSGCVGTKENGIKTSDGEIVAGDNIKWPESNMGGLQKPDANITAVIKDDTSGSYTVAFSGMSKEKAVQYVAKLKEQGYQSIMEVNDTDGIMFSGKNTSGILATFTYNNTAKEGSISYVPNTSESSGTVSNSSDSKSSVDMTDVSPWPQNFMSGISEMEGKITDVLNQNDENVTVELEYVEKSDFEAYVSTLKKNGYTVDADETKDSSGYDYRAYNQKGDYINASMSYEYKKATVYMEKAVTE